MFLNFISANSDCHCHLPNARMNSLVYRMGEIQINHYFDDKSLIPLFGYTLNDVPLEQRYKILFGSREVECNGLMHC